MAERWYIERFYPLTGEWRIVAAGTFASMSFELSRMSGNVQLWQA